MRIYTNKKKNRFVLRDFNDNTHGQIFLIGGVIIVLAILTFGVVSTSISDISETIDKSSFLMPEYSNIRKEFGVALKNKIEDNIIYFNDDPIEIETYINYYFHDTWLVFTVYEALHGNYFYAEYERLIYKGENPVGLVAKLSLSNGYDVISEEVSYYFL